LPRFPDSIDGGFVAIGGEEQKMTPDRFGNFRLYLRQRPAMLGLLTASALLFFLIVTGLSRVYHAQREALGDRWFDRGVAHLNAKRYEPAVTEFRAALLYSRDNYAYQLNLAEALIGTGQTGQAYAYLLNLWDREPENGRVNLELARIVAARGQTQQAIRYYHDAVYAAWPENQESQRQEARLELIDLLLRSKANAPAQAELIALSANEAEEPALEDRLGDLFMRAGDHERALAAYRLGLKSDQHDAAALAGAGNAAFQLGRYRLAEHYFEGAVAANANDQASAERLKMTEMVLRTDPFQPEISLGERNRLVVQAFATAGRRLMNCAKAKNAAAKTGSTEPNLVDEWTSLKPRVSLRNLERNPLLADRAMSLVFRIEKRTSVLCESPTATDSALLLISKLHEGS
jgi:tetratricopeptide (TPR) repeat protein